MKMDYGLFTFEACASERTDVRRNRDSGEMERWLAMPFEFDSRSHDFKQISNYAVVWSDLQGKFARSVEEAYCSFESLDLEEYSDFSRYIRVLASDEAAVRVCYRWYLKVLKEELADAAHYNQLWRQEQAFRERMQTSPTQGAGRPSPGKYNILPARDGSEGEDEGSLLSRQRLGPLEEMVYHERMLYAANMLCEELRLLFTLREEK